MTGDGFNDAFGGHQFTWHVVSVGGGGSSPATSSNGGRGFAYRPRTARRRASTISMVARGPAAVDALPDDVQRRCLEITETD